MPAAPALGSPSTHPCRRPGRAPSSLPHTWRSARRPSTSIARPCSLRPQHCPRPRHCRPTAWSSQDTPPVGPGAAHQPGSCPLHPAVLCPGGLGGDPGEGASLGHSLPPYSSPRVPDNHDCGSHHHSQVPPLYAEEASCLGLGCAHVCRHDTHMPTVFWAWPSLARQPGGVEGSWGHHVCPPLMPWWSGEFRDKQRPALPASLAWF